MAKITSLLFVLPVRDVDKAVRFYCDAFELQEVYRDDNIVFVGIPGTETSFGIYHDPLRPAAGRRTSACTSTTPPTATTR